MPTVLLEGGIPMGRVKFKGAEHTVHWPVTDRDELCLSRVMIGKQGSGKTTAASNFAIVCMTANANRVTPFLMKASPPLPVQENRSSVRLECRYGRPISQVSGYIEEKEQIFYV